MLGVFWYPTEVMEDGGNALAYFRFESNDWGFEFALLLGIAFGEGEDVDGDVDQRDFWKLSF